MCIDPIKDRNKKIENVVFDCGGRIFGGYVRDILRGVPPNDMDVYLSKTKIPGFLMKLMRVIPIQILQEHKECYSHLRIGVQFGIQHIDVLDPREIELYSLRNSEHSWHNPDANVNRLVLDASGALKIEGSHDLLGTLNNIANGRYYAELGMSQERRKKLDDKGWKNLY